MPSAAFYYQLAATQGHASAQYNLGICYQKGDVVTVDMKAACRNYKLASDQGHIIAHYNLGLCYETGNGVEQDEHEALRLYKASAAGKHVEAVMRLAELRASGAFVRVGYGKDLEEAKNLHKEVTEACTRGEAAAPTAHAWVEDFSQRNFELLVYCNNLSCGKNTDTSLKVCSQCRQAYYCSVKCQREDWKARHFQACKAQ